MATAHLLGLDDDREELLRRSGMVDYVRRCQVGEWKLGVGGGKLYQILLTAGRCWA